MKDKIYYKKLDIIRVISCIAIFLYHLNILKGGFLAVCTFFVLSGYLSCKSAFSKEKFSLLNYYKNRFIHIYLPLLIVVFLSITAISFLKDINWLTLKPETTSVIFGYNNFWQIDANMDYFARHISSPFMHFWYIGILLQFELIFPLIFIPLKKIKEKIKPIPIILLTTLTIITTLYFYVSCNKDTNIMNVYYNTFTRIFSCIFGMTLGFIISSKNFAFKNKIINNIIFYLYLIILILLFIFIDSKSNLFALSMILTTIISCRLIDYGTTLNSNLNIFDKFMKYLSSISYEIYLFQYPVIFIFQYVILKDYISLPLIFIITIISSIILHLALNFKKKKIYKYILLVIISGLSIFGLYQYIITEDHTKEMNELEKQLSKNEEMMKKKQEEYKKSLEKENSEWEEKLKEIENGSSNLNEVITNLPIVGVGDSVMLGAVSKLYQTFPNGYFDAKVSRTDYEANAIFRTLSNNGTLGNPIVIHLGTNGQCGASCRNEILSTLGDRKIFWITVTNDYEVHVNNDIIDYVNNHDNCYLIDWATISNGHTEYFAADRIHLTSSGMEAYSKTIYDAIYNNYLEEYNKLKEEAINKHNNELKEKITFYGNDLLLNSSTYLEKDFTNSEFIIDNFTYDKLINEIKKNKPNYNVVLLFDKSFEITNNQYKEILNLLKDHKVYILKIDKDLNITNDNIEIIDFSNDIKNYLMVDNIHLTDKGNLKLSELLKTKLLTK